MSPYSAQRRKTRLALETLEQRTVPALIAEWNRGVLGVWGTDASDEIVVRQVAGRISVDSADITVNGVVWPSLSVASIGRIEIICGAGDDTVYLNSHTVAGQQAITRPTIIWGEDGNDWIEGSQGSDRIYTGTGEDVAYGHGSNDIFLAEGAKCWLYGGGGNDRIEAEAGEMILDGGLGSDRLLAYGDGNGWLDGGVGNDSLTGGDGPDVLTGGPGNDILFGGWGADDLDGGTGFDILWGGSAPKQETLDDGLDIFRDEFNFYQPVYKGTSVADVMQMGSPLCTTLASMSAAIWSGFNFADSIDYAGDNEFGVAMFNPDTGEWEGHAVYFDGTWTDLDANVPRSAAGYVMPEFWPVLIARASLQQRGIDLSVTDIDYVETYYPTVASDAIMRLSSWDAVDLDMAVMTPIKLQAAIDAGHSVVASTYNALPEEMTPGVVPNHAYTVLDVMYAGGFWYAFLHNPWGRDFDPTTRARPAGLDDGIIVLRWDQFVADFFEVARTV